jgi:hypothetical protein
MALEWRGLSDDARTGQLSPEAEIASILRRVRGLVTLSFYRKQQLVEQVKQGAFGNFPRCKHGS